MFGVSDVLPGGTVSELAPGSSLLIAGPALSGKQALALDLLAAGHDGDDGLLIVSTGESAGTYLDELEQRVGTVDRNRVGVLDCSGSSQQEAIREIATQRVSSPGDLTGISIATAKLMEQLTSQDISGVRHGLVSVSTLLQYLEPQTVFKFLHIYTRRIDDTGGLGIFLGISLLAHPIYLGGRSTRNSVACSKSGVRLGRRLIARPQPHCAQCPPSRHTA